MKTIFNQIIILMLIMFYFMVSDVIIEAQEPTPVPIFSEFDHARLQSKTEADGIDEIILLGTDNHLYVYDYRGQQQFQSVNGNWRLITTGDLNADGDDEIVAVSEDRIKVYYDKVSIFRYETQFDNLGYFPKRVVTGNFLKDDVGLEIVLLLNKNDDQQSLLLVFNPPYTVPIASREWETIGWRDFAAGDYDGDSDDDLVLIGWNYDRSVEVINRGMLTLLEGENIYSYLQNNIQANSTFDDEWLDIASGLIDPTYLGTDWAGSTIRQQTTYIEYWNAGTFEAWNVGIGANFVATADFRGEGDDQIVLLKSDPLHGGEIQFAKMKKVWSEDNSLGDGWLNLSAGNLDTEQTYCEAILLKEDLVRIYLVPQAGPIYLDCTNPEFPTCFEFSGSFNGELAIGDVGQVIDELYNYRLYLPIVVK